MLMFAARLACCMLFLPTTVLADPVKIDRGDILPAAVGQKTPVQQYKYKLCLGSDSGETDTCEVAFPPIPAKTRAEVSGVSCLVRSSGDVQVEYIQLLINKGNTIVTAQSLVPTLTSSVVHPVTQVPRNNYVVNDQVTAYVAAGQEIHFLTGFLKVEKGDNIVLYCHWSGNLISLR